jgi:hypothetical protein
VAGADDEARCGGRHVRARTIARVRPGGSYILLCKVNTRWTFDPITAHIICSHQLLSRRDSHPWRLVLCPQQVASAPPRRPATSLPPCQCDNMRPRRAKGRNAGSVRDPAALSPLAICICYLTICTLSFPLVLKSTVYLLHFSASVAKPYFRHRIKMLCHC